MRQGLVSNLANSKMAVFFLSLLPQFVPAGASSFALLLLFGLLFCVMTFLWLATYSLAVDSARRLLDRTNIRRTLDALTGSVLVAFGAQLALEQR